MNRELIYSVSEHANTLVIKIQEAERDQFVLTAIKQQRALTLDLLKTLQTSKDSALVAFLIQQESLYLKKTTGRAPDARTPFNLVHVGHQNISELLRFFAMNGRLYFNDKALVVDLFGKTELYYRIDQVNNVTVTNLHVTSGSQEYLLSSCDFIGRGPPHWIIKGMALKIISTDIDWKELQSAVNGTPYPIDEILLNSKEDVNAPKVVIPESFTVIQKEPLPVLILTDRSGAFANLWMDYGDGSSLVSYHDPVIKKRQMIAERGWEKDLLETDFVLKNVGTSHYYCPIDKVAKSLSFLLEIGWQIKDWKDKKVVHHQEATISAEMQEGMIAIKGKVKYDCFHADLTTIVGAFNRRERFVEIAIGHVALLPTNWESMGLDYIIDEGEVVGDTVRIKAHCMNNLTEFFDKQSHMQCDQSLMNLKKRLTDFKEVTLSPPSDQFHGELRPYQQEGVNWLSFLYEFGFHGMLADDMGLGKTIQVLAFLSRIECSSSVLIVVPTSLLFNWMREIKRFLPSAEVIIHHGSDRGTFQGLSPRKSVIMDHLVIILTSYTTLRLDLPFFIQHRYSCLILDEAQAIKNSQTQIFKAVARLNAQFRLSITGTPIENNILELWSHFHFLMPDLLGEEAPFKAELQAGQSDNRFFKRIKKQIRPFLLRRYKEDVALDLPEKIEQIVWVEMTADQRRLYESVLSNARSQLMNKVSADGVGKHRMEILEVIMRLRQICCHPLLVQSGEASEGLLESAKLDALMQDIEIAISEKRKILVYSQFTSMLTLIKKRIYCEGWTYVYLDGSTKDREKVVNQFQEDPSTYLFLISLKAGGVGLNLTAADYVFLYDPWWNTAVENQAINRAHRIGCKQTVIAKRYIVAESIEEKMMKLKTFKSSLADDLFDEEGKSSALTADDLLFLLSD